MDKKKDTYVFISAPYTKGDVGENVNKAICAADALADAGLIPFVPHLTHLWHLIIPQDIDFWYKYDLAWLDKCDCLVRLNGESAGADNEVEYARKHGKPVFYSVHECIMAVFQ